MNTSQKKLTDQMSRAQLASTVNRLLDAEAENMTVIEQQKKCIRRLELTFCHEHVDNGSGNICKQCGLHRLNEIHAQGPKL